MNKALSLALLIVGVLLLGWGVNASDSASSHVSRFFTGSPTDESVWLLVGGLAASIFGVAGLLGGTRSH